METANYDLHLDKGWHFCHGDVKRFGTKKHGTVYNFCKAGGALGSRRVFFEENPWREISVPHDFLTELPYDENGTPSGGYKIRGSGWYYVSFTLPDAPIERARLVFEGVLGQTTVYVNGTVAGRNFSGYNRFTCETAAYLIPGEENTVALHVDASTWEGWSYEGAGLYRPVYIEFREDACLSVDGSFVRGEFTDGAWSVCADLSVLGDAADATLLYRLVSPDGETLTAVKIDAAPSVSLRIPVEDARLWSPENPTLYRFFCELRREGRVLDTVALSVGLRTVEWIAEKGMYLNGAPYRIKGVCCHQDHGGVGVAVTPELMEYRITQLKSVGINAYRCAHHAVPGAFLEICDRLGMLVMVENRHFSVCEDAMRQLESLVRVARNHPSVFLYSLFNEEPWQKERRGYLMAREMTALVRSLDSTRAVTGAMNGGTLGNLNASDAYDVIGMNYGLKYCEETHMRSPSKVILGSENAPTFATRGEYVTDNARQVFTSYCDDYAKSFSESLTETMELSERLPYHAGSFLWSGFDGYGESQPHEWPSIASHWGLFDLCGFPKDTAYLVAAWYKDELSAHLLPHWNHTAGENVRVAVFTNADTAELCLNGRSLGVRAVKECRAEWQVAFEPGTIRVTARRGAEAVTCERVTAGAPAWLSLEDVTPIGKDRKLSIVNVRMTDGEGVTVPDCSATVRVSLVGGAILGVSNGDPNSHHPNVSDEIPLFHGCGQIILSGEAEALTASCDGVPSEILDIRR